MRASAPGPIELGVLRIVVFGVLLGCVDVWTAADFAALPSGLRSPDGLLIAHLPIDPVAARVAQGVFASAAACALVGWRTRLAAAIATLAALYLLAIPQLYGTVRHYHHLVWLGALCAAAPSGDALSIDALLRARSGDPQVPSRTRAHALPVWLAWILIGCVLLFPGLWKWGSAGLPWALSDNLVRVMQGKWLEHGWLPPLRIDRWPTVCRVGALSVMVLEVVFIVSLPFPRLRRLAVLGALVFHVCAALFLHIVFASLMWCYVAFVPWSRLIEAPYARALARLGRARGGLQRPSSARPVAVVGAILIVGVVWCGARGQTHGWPFACYPTFATLASDTIPDLEVELVDASGAARLAPRPRLTGVDAERRWALVWSVLRSPVGARLRAYANLIEDPTPESTAQHRFYRIARPVDPARWDAPPRERVLIATLDREPY